MKYWSYLVAKVVLAGGILYGLRWVLLRMLPAPQTFLYVRQDPFAHELGYTLAMMLYWLLAVGLGWAIVWDQRYRCRTCVRRLRMPIQTGSWNHILVGAPQTEYICLYGHGTLTVSELQITGHQEPDWAPHADMWKELFSLEETKK